MRLVSSRWLHEQVDDGVAEVGRDGEPQVDEHGDERRHAIIALRAGPASTYDSSRRPRDLTTPCTPAAQRPSARPASPTRGRARLAGEGVVAPRPCPRPHLQGLTPLEVHHENALPSTCPPPTPGIHGHARGLGAPPPRAGARHLPGRPRPQRPRPGRAAGRRPAVPPEETTVRVTGTATANAQAPGGVEVTDAGRRAADRAGRDPAGRAVAPALDVSLPTLLDHAPVALAPPGPARPWELAAASLRGFRATLDGLGFTEVTDPEVRGVGDRVGGQRLRGRLLRAAGLPRPEPAVLQAAAGRASSSASTRSARSSAPSRTTRCATSRSTAPSTSSSASSRTTATCSRCCARCWPAWSPRSEHAAPAVERTGARLPVVPDRDPGDPLRRRARAGRRARRRAGPRARARAGARRVGAGEHGSDFLAVEGYPMAKRPFYTPPAARRRAGGRTASTCSSAGSSW